MCTGTGADIGRDHEQVMVTFRNQLNPIQRRLEFEREKFRAPELACTFQSTLGRKFAPLKGLRDDGMTIETMITIYNTALTDAASEIFGKEGWKKKPWIIKVVLDLKKRWYKAEEQEIFSSSGLQSGP